MVNSMLVPVSASATGKTFSRLISSVWAIRSPTEVWAQSRRADASSRRPDFANSYPPPTPQTDLAVGVSLSTAPDIAGHIDRPGPHPVDTVLAFALRAGILVRLSGRPVAVSGETDEDPVSTDPRSSRYGCRLRYLREGPRLRQVGVALPSPDQPSLGSEHPERARRRPVPAATRSASTSARPASRQARSPAAELADATSRSNATRSRQSATDARAGASRSGRHPSARAVRWRG